MINAKKWNLPECTIPDYNDRELESVSRRNEILKELESSGAKLIILLGDLPIKHFLSHYTDDQRNTLAAFGKSVETYGKIHSYRINKNDYQVLPLVHPRQAGQLGLSYQNWFELHKNWCQKKGIHF